MCITWAFFCSPPKADRLRVHRTVCREQHKLKRENDLVLAGATSKPDLLRFFLLYTKQRRSKH